MRLQLDSLPCPATVAAVIKTPGLYMQFGDGPEAERDPMQTDIPDGHTEVQISGISQCVVTRPRM